MSAQGLNVTERKLVMMATTIYIDGATDCSYQKYLALTSA